MRGRGWAVRHLPDDEAIERFYREVLQPLGTTTTRRTDSGVTLDVTELPGGGRVVLRKGSNSGGYAIDVRLAEVPFKRIHRAE